MLSNAYMLIMMMMMMMFVDNCDNAIVVEVDQYKWRLSFILFLNKA